MKLKEYLKLQKISNNSFSKLLGISLFLCLDILVVRDFRKNILINIYNLTEGFVTPNDFALRTLKKIM